MFKEPSEQKHHTYGSSKAAEILYDIMKTATKQEKRKVGRIFQHCGATLNRLTTKDELDKYLANLVRENVLGKVDKMTLPRSMKTHLRNVLCTMYKEWLRSI